MFSAYLLVSHGSCDSRHQAGLSRLASLLRQQLDPSLSEEISVPMVREGPLLGLDDRQAEETPLAVRPSQIHPTARPETIYRKTLKPSPVVGAATLESARVPLSQQIVVFAERVAAQGVQQVIILPLFLISGIHVKEDLPREIETARAHLSAPMNLVCASYLGEHLNFRRFLSSRLQAMQADRCVLLAHGSRRQAGNRTIQQLGAVIDADVAFWKVAPSLETKVVELMQQGHQHIVIAPYFLFPGRITDAVIQYTEDLAERLPKLSIRLLAPLGASTELGMVIAQIARCAAYPEAASSPFPRDRWSAARDSVMA